MHGALGKSDETDHENKVERFNSFFLSDCDLKNHRTILTNNRHNFGYATQRETMRH